MKKKEVDYIDHPAFANPEELNIIMNREVPEKPSSVWFDKFMNSSDINSSVGKLHEYVELTREQEETLFVRLNYARKMMKEIKASGINDSNKVEYFKHFKTYKNTEDYLIKYNLRLIISVICKKFLKQTVVNFEDMISNGYVSLTNSVRLFDVSKGFKFSTLAVTAIYRGILTAYRDNKKERENCPASIEEELDSGKTFKVNEKNSFDLELLHKYLNFETSSLTKDEIMVIKSRFPLDSDEVVTYENIGNSIGMSRGWAVNVEKSALRKLKNAFCEK